MKWRLDTALGYMYSIDKNSPYADVNGKLYQHHYVMGEHIGRPLRDGECVHHIDRDRTNNNLSNLRLMTASDHAKLHAIEDRGYRAETRFCRKCSKELIVSVKSSQVYCSRKCCDLDSRLFEIDPQELRALVWSMPTTKVAKILGVSDVAVSQRCKKYGIDKPPRGYWAKVKAGKI